MKSTQDTENEARDFWQSFLTEEGETMVAKSMGGWKSGPGKDDIAWGVIALTSHRFIYREMVSEKSILGIRISSTSSERKKREAMELVIPRASIIALYEGPKGFFARLFGPPFPLFKLSWNEAAEGGTELQRTESFSADPGSDILPALRGLLA